MTVDEGQRESRAAAPARRSGPGLTAILAALVVLATVAGSVYLILSEPKPKQVIVWIPSRTIPAYSRIDEVDVTSRTFSEDQLSNDSYREKGSLVGRIALERLDQAELVHKNEVGAAIAPTGLQSKVVTSVQLTYSQALGGQLRSGDVISLSGVGAKGEAIEVSGLMVLDSRQQPNAAEYATVIVANSTQASDTSRINRSSMMVSRDSAYGY